MNNKKMTKKELIKKLKDEFDKYCQSVQKWMKKCDNNGMTYYLSVLDKRKTSVRDIINDLNRDENLNNWLIKTR